MCASYLHVRSNLLGAAPVISHVEIDCAPDSCILLPHNVRVLMLVFPSSPSRIWLLESSKLQSTKNIQKLINKRVFNEMIKEDTSEIKFLDSFIDPHQFPKFGRNFRSYYAFYKKVSYLLVRSIIKNLHLNKIFTF